MSYVETFARRVLAAALAFVMVFTLALVPIAGTVAYAEGADDEPVTELIEVTVTADDTTKVYGKADPKLTATVVGVAEGDEISYTLTRQEGENVGEYVITPSGETTQGNYSITYKTGTLTITPNTEEVTVKITGNSATEVYDATEKSVTGYTTDVGEKTITVALAKDSKAEAKGTNVGDYYMGLTEDDFTVKSDNYSNIKVVVVDGKLTVKKATLTVEIKGNTGTKTYDGKEMTVEDYSTFCNSKLFDAGNVENNGKASVTAKNAGKHDMGLTADQFSYNSDNENFDVVFDVTDGYLQIDKRNVTLTSATDSKIYDNEPLTNHTIKVDGDGFAEGEGATYEVTGSQTDKGESDNTFTYTLNEGTLAGNYEIETVFGKLTVYAIGGVVVKIKGVRSGEIKYDGEEHTIQGYDVEIEGDERYTKDDFELVGTEAKVTETNAGTYKMGLTSESFQNNNENFDVTFVIESDGCLEITKREVILTSATDEKPYDGKALTKDEVEVTGDGFVEGEVTEIHATGTVTNVSEGEVTNTIEYTTGENFKEDNYIITKEEGTLKITQAESSLQFADINYRQEQYEDVVQNETEKEYHFNAEFTGDEQFEGREIHYSIQAGSDTDYTFNEGTGDLTVRSLGSYTVSATIDGSENYLEKTIQCVLNVTTKDNVLHFYVANIDYIIGTSDIVSEQNVGAPGYDGSLKKLKITYSIDKTDIGLEIENRSSFFDTYLGGKVTVTDYEKLANALNENGDELIITVEAKSVAYYGWGSRPDKPTVPEGNASYTITVKYAEMPEGETYTNYEGKLNNTGWYVLNGTENGTEKVKIKPVEGYEIAYEVKDFFDDEIDKDSVTIEDQGRNVSETVYLRKIEDGSIGKIKCPAIKIDYQPPIEVKISTKEKASDILKETISLGFYKGKIDITIEAKDATSGLNRVEWKYVKEDGTSGLNKSDETGTAKFVEGKATITLSGDYDGDFSYVVYDNAGNSTEGDDGGRFIVDSTAPELVSVKYNGETAENDKQLNFNRADLSQTSGGKTVTAEITIDEANFAYNKEKVSITKNGKTVTPKWSDKADVGTFTISGEGDYKVVIDYSDPSGNEMTTHTNTIVIDTTDPSMDFTYSAPAKTEGTTRYYGSGEKGQATVTIHITDKHCASGDVYVDGKLVKSTWKDQTASITVSGSGDHKVTVTATDDAGNTSTATSDLIIIDTAEPEIVVTYSPNDIINSIDGIDYYDVEQIATVTVTEDHFDPAGVTFDKGDGKKFTVSEWRNEGNRHQTEISFADDNNYNFKVNATDKANNKAAEYSHLLTVDMTPPTDVRIDVDGVSDENTKDGSVFFKDEVTVRLTATDETAGVHSLAFAYERDANASSKNLDKLTKAIEEADFTVDGKTVHVTFTLPRDAAEALEEAQLNGSFSVTAADRSGNSATGTYQYLVVLDDKAPGMEVSFDDPSNETENAWYYNDDATGTIRIIEANFNPDQVEVSVTRNGAPYEVPTLWEEGTEDEYFGTLVLSEEGDYVVTVTYTDGSGNEATPYVSKQIVVDRTADVPTVRINDVEISGEIGGAYAGDIVKIDYELEDLNLAEDGVTLEVLLTPSFKEQKNVTGDKSYYDPEFTKNAADHKTTCTGSFLIADDLDENGVSLDDGIYDLTITVTDLAGNTASKYVQFAVCRYGSVYQYGGGFAEKIGTYMSRKDGQSAAITEDLIIYEYCPTKLEADEETILITVQRDTRTVDIDVKREVVREDPNEGWYQYKYVIDKSKFEADGKYEILISSAYKATDDGNADEAHVSSISATNSFDKNGTRINQNAWFVVDTEAPNISNISNLGETIIDAREVTVDFTVEDHGGIQDVKVYVNGTETDVQKSDTNDQFTFNGSFVIGESSEAQDVRIVVEDIAGNKTDTTTEAFKEQINGRYVFNDKVTVSTNLFVRWYANKPLFWGSIGGAAAIAAGASAAVVARRRKKGVI